MNIVIATGIYPPDIGGPATYVHALAAWLSKHGHSPIVVTYGDAPAVSGDGWSVRTVPRSGGPVIRYARYFWTVFCLARRADMVYLQGPVSEGFPGAVAARLAFRPFALKVVGDYAWEFDQRRGGKELLDDFVKWPHGGAVGLVERIERWVARGAKKIIVPSRYLKGIVESWNVPAEKIRVIYSVVEPLPVVDRASARETLGINKDAFVILSVMRAVPWKGGDFLCECLKALPQEFQLVLAGDGPALDDWKRQAQALGVEHRVRFLGRVGREDLAHWYAAADVFALPSSYEGFPHVVVEAAQSGLPCAVSDRGGNPEAYERYPEHVKVLAYRDLNAWTEWFMRKSQRLPAAPTRSFDDVAKDTETILQNVCAS